LRHAQLGLRGGYTCARGVEIGLLLGRIEPGEELAGIDVRANVYKAREHAPAHTKGELGAETGLDIAGQGHGGLSILRPHDFSVHQRGTLDRSNGVIIAGTEGRRQKRERKCGTHWPA
jgi:hypothetical protein